jgi:hypothetical protein
MLTEYRPIGDLSFRSPIRPLCRVRLYVYLEMLSLMRRHHAELGTVVGKMLRFLHPCPAVKVASPGEDGPEDGVWLSKLQSTYRNSERKR